MRQRTKAEETISRGQSGLMNVPITPASRRRFRLMQEDSVTLSFALPSPFHFRIGDFIIDELFGKFVLTEEQMPGYNKSSGGYEYSLRFDKEYFLWKNYVFMLTYTAERQPYTTSPLANRVLAGFHIDTTGYTGGLSLAGLRIGILSRGYGGSWGILLRNGDGQNVMSAWMSSEQTSQTAVSEGIKLTATYTWAGMEAGTRIVDVELTGQVFREGSMRSRIEASWSLTDKLEAHAAELVRNLEAITGYDYSEGYCVLPNGEELLLENGERLYLGDPPLDGTAYDVVIHDSAAHAGETHHIQYNGVTILAALGMMASEFGCEWWVTYEDLKHGTIHFGKCESDGEPYTMELGVNVESMSISRDSSSYANRIMALGSTKNIPDSYRKTLTFTVGEVMVWGQRYMLYRDTEKDLKPSMVAGSSEVSVGFAQNADWYFYEYRREDNVMMKSFPSGRISIAAQDECVFNGSLTVHPYLYYSRGYGAAEPEFTGEVKLFVEDEQFNNVATLMTESKRINGEGNSAEFIISLDDKKVSLPAGEYHIALTYTVTSTGALPRFQQRQWADSEDSERWCRVTIPLAGKWCMLRYDDANYPVKIGAIVDDDGYEHAYLMFVNAIGSETVALVPEGFAIGAQYTLDFEDTTQTGVPHGLIRSRIPTSWWLSDFDDPSSLRSLGENRLRLPLAWCPNGWLQLDTTLAKDQIVEETVVFEKIFPRLFLRIENVMGEKKTDKTETTDGSEGAWEWTQWSFEVKNIDGTAFPFRSDMVKSGEKLQAEFLSEMDEEEAYGDTSNRHEGYLLAGMAFDVSFNGNTGRYTLVRNEDYGAKLPNDNLCPKEGDLIVLTGWDADNMASLGLIGKAEDDLWHTAAEYLDAIMEGNFTFDCDMMSQWPFEVFGSENGATAENPYGWIPFDVADGEYRTKGQGTSHLYFYVVNDRYYVMPAEGARARIVHDGLLDGEKVSRVIGYELKLDIPYDTPRYTVGETDAYSRLKQIEKQISRL